jgi:ribosomal RNA methyltransferase Nop2
LDESLVTRKRKDAPPAAVPERTKRSRTDAREKAAAKATPPKKSAAANGTKTRVNGKPAKKFAPPPPANDDVMSDSADGIDDPDVMENGLENVNVTGLDALGRS